MTCVFYIGGGIAVADNNKQAVFLIWEPWGEETTVRML